MNDMLPLASAAGMTVGLAVCALGLGLVLAMLFAVLESAKWRPVGWLATALVTLLRGLPEILVENLHCPQLDQLVNADQRSNSCQIEEYKCH